MVNLLRNLKSLVSVKVYVPMYIIIFLLTLFMEKIVDLRYDRHKKKLLAAKDKRENKLVLEFMEKYNMKKQMNEFCNYAKKVVLYFFIGIGSAIQILFIMTSKKVAFQDANVCMLTMTLSFIELNENIMPFVKVTSALLKEYKELGKQLWNILN